MSEMFGVVGGRRQAKGWADPWRMADRSDLPTPCLPPYGRNRSPSEMGSWGLKACRPKGRRAGRSALAARECSGQAGTAGGELFRGYSEGESMQILCNMLWMMLILKSNNRAYGDRDRMESLGCDTFCHFVTYGHVSVMEGLGVAGRLPIGLLDGCPAIFKSA